MKFRKIFIVSLFLWLTGCHEVYTHEYLLQHPNVVQKELKACQQEKEYTSYCDMVKHTSEEFEALIQSCAQAPQAFGQQIILLQMKQGSLQKNSNEYHVVHQQIQTLYAVVASINSEQLK